jgi:hypothetical protein
MGLLYLYESLKNMNDSYIGIRLEYVYVAYFSYVNMLITIIIINVMIRVMVIIRFICISILFYLSSFECFYDGFFNSKLIK